MRRLSTLGATRSVRCRLPPPHLSFPFLEKKLPSHPPPLLPGRSIEFLLSNSRRNSHPGTRVSPPDLPFPSSVGPFLSPLSTRPFLPFQRLGFGLGRRGKRCGRCDSVNCTCGSSDALVHVWTHLRIEHEAAMATGMPYGLQAMLKEGHSYFAGINEAVLKNIEACRGLARITRTSMGPAGATSVDVRNERTMRWKGSKKETRADRDDLRSFQDRTSCW